MEESEAGSGGESLCRLCLTTRGETLAIFPSDSTSEPHALASKILACVAVEISEDDGLPTQICKKCASNVNNWHVFKRVCEESQLRLRDWMSRETSASEGLAGIKIKKEPYLDEADDMTIDASYPGIELVEGTGEIRIQPEGPPILTSLGLAPRNEKDNGSQDELEDEELTVEEALAIAAAAAAEAPRRPPQPILHRVNHGRALMQRPILSHKVMVNKGTFNRPGAVAQLASKDCLVCGRAYRYSHNARRHELNSHNYDRYTNKNNPDKTSDVNKLRPNPYNAKSRLLVNPAHHKLKYGQKMHGKNVMIRIQPHPVRIRSLSEMQRKPHEPQILKSLLTSRPEIVVAEPECIVRSGSESPENLVAEPEITSFQVEDIVTEPDTYNNYEGCDDEDMDDEEGDKEGEEMVMPECEVELSEEVDINKIIGVDTVEKDDHDGADQDGSTSDQLANDADPSAPQVEQQGNLESEIVLGDVGNNDDGDNDKPEDGEDDENDGEMEGSNVEGRLEPLVEAVYPDEANENGIEDGEEGESGEEGGDDEDDLPLVPHLSVIEMNDEQPSDLLEEDNMENGILNESLDIQGIGNPNTITPQQKEFFVNHRDVIEQINTMKCHCCQKSYPRRKAVIQHLQKNGVQVPKHTCYNCVLTFTHIGALLSHMRANCCNNRWRLIYEEGGIPDDMVQEGQPVQEYIAKSANNSLSKSLYKDILNARSYACKLCPSKFQLKQFIMKHIIDVHENGGQRIPLHCQHCRMRFKENRLWKKHVRNGECTVNIACDLCPERFASLQDFTDHAWAVHASGEPSTDQNQTRAVDGRPTECPICHKENSSYHNLVKHLKAIHNEEKPHMCQHCDSKYETVTELNDHIYLQHSDRTPIPSKVDLSIVKHEQTMYNYSCTECAEVFDSVDGWTEHQITVHEHQAYECNQCDKKFLQDSELEEHKNNHLRVRFYTCTLCSNSYGSPQKLSEHMLKTHQGETLNDISDSNPFFCEICLRPFKSPQAYSNHMRIHAVVPTTNRRSGEPTKIVMQKKIVQRPMQKQFIKTVRYKRVTPGGLAPYSCDICGKGFQHKKNIWKHKKMLHADIVGGLDKANHSGSNQTFINASTEEDDYANDDIGGGLSIPQFDSFNMTEIMDQPMVEEVEQSNSPEDMYQCDMCDKKFAVRSSIWKHKRVKHGIINPGQEEAAVSKGDYTNRTSCTLCKISFADKKAYYRHRKNVHRLTTHTCKICQKTLGSTMELYEHLKTAHAKELLGYNEGPRASSEMHQQGSDEDGTDGQYEAKFPCDTCGKSFLGMAALQNHKCAPGQGERFGCEICNKSYTSISALKSHRGWHLRSPDGKAAFSNSGLWMPQRRVSNKPAKHDVYEETSQPRHSTPVTEIAPLHIKRKLPPDIQVTVLKKRKLNDEVTMELVKAPPKEDYLTVQRKAIVVESREDPYCNMCGKGFTKKAAYLRHMEEVHQPNSVFCPICNKSFTRKSTLLIHMRKHQNETLVDPDDEMEPEEEMDMEMEMEEPEHLQVVQEAEKMYACDICNFRYSSAKSLKRHCMKHHNIAPEDMIEERSGPVVSGTRTIEVGGPRQKCGQCGEEFTCEEDVWNHRHYLCSPCGQYFSRPEHLAAHSRTCNPEAEKEKQFFSCTMCERFYLTKKSLQRHVEAAHAFN